MRIFNFLLPKSALSPRVAVDGQEVFCEARPSGLFDASLIVRPEAPSPPTETGPPAPLIDIAWARSGDKGNLFNVGVFARDPVYYPWLVEALTAQAVGDWFAHLVDDPQQPRVQRFLLPATSGLNFVVHDSLGGGGSLCARIDPLAKSMAQLLLEFPIPLPERFHPFQRHLAGEE